MNTLETGSTPLTTLLGNATTIPMDARKYGGLKEEKETAMPTEKGDTMFQTILDDRRQNQISRERIAVLNITEIFV